MVFGQTLSNAVRVCVSGEEEEEKELGDWKKAIAASDHARITKNRKQRHNKAIVFTDHCLDMEDEEAKWYIFFHYCMDQQQSYVCTYVLHINVVSFLGNSNSWCHSIMGNEKVPIDRAPGQDSDRKKRGYSTRIWNERMEANIS